MRQVKVKGTKTMVEAPYGALSLKLSGARFLAKPKATIAGSLTEARSTPHIISSTLDPIECKYNEKNYGFHCYKLSIS